jgi:hypothetical protein
MKQHFLRFAIFVFLAGTVFAQNAENPVAQMDETIKTLARSIHNKFTAEKAQKIAVGQFSFQGTASVLGAYWSNQLSGELSNISGRSYVLLSGGLAGADWTISGEIVSLPGIIRIFTRLVRTENRSLEATFNIDLERSAALTTMLSSSGGSGGSGSSQASQDEWEPDGWENPLAYEIGANESVAVMNRTLHEGDEDFFLLVCEETRRVTAETTGSIDTYMHLYNYETREELAKNDDGASGDNARIRFTLQAGTRYLAKVRGYSDRTNGSYGFRAYFFGEALSPDQYEPNDDSSSANLITIGTPQQHTFYHGDDIDWVKFQITQPGRYTIRARGVRSNSLDTVIELFDANLNSIAEDDDGGESYDSRLSRQLQSGLYYLKVRCLDDDPDQAYTISITAE